MPKKKITMEDLAAMVKRGFDDTARKKDVESLQKDMKYVKGKLGSLDTRMKNVEHLLLKQHSDQLRGLDTRVRRLEQLYSIKFQ